MPPFRLIIAEKPSVARDIARVLGVSARGDGYLEGDDLRVTWCVGHLIELDEPASYDPEWKSWGLEHLPMLPQAFRLHPRKEANDQWKVVKGLLRDRDLKSVVNACDAGREGELIFAYVYEAAGCKAPVERLWISSMTTQSIRDGFKRLRPGPSMKHLEAAARCRSEADWLVGLNATRAMTTRFRTGNGGTLLSLGRVQTPTLALIVERELAIERFVPQDFWELRAQHRTDVGDWEGTWTFRNPEGKAETRLFDQGEARAVLDRVQGLPARIVRVEGKQVRERPPLLYDLTTLQKECNRRFHFSAQVTLDHAQALYERHKVISYPRTDSRHIGTDQEAGLPDLVASLDFGPYAAAVQDIQARWPIKLDDRVVDDAEVSDHHAILPTGTDPREAGLSPDEKRVFDLVARRLLAVLHPDAVFDVREVDVAVEQPAFDDHFLARGRACLELGWQRIDPPRGQKKDTELPPVLVDMPVENVALRLHEGRTQPPRHHNEATLLTGMERAGEGVEEEALKRVLKRNGLGTPATRAAIIETLLHRNYIVRNGQDLLATAAGRALLEALPVEDLKSARLTGQWEARLVEMAEGHEERDVFMADIRSYTQRLVDLIKGAEPARELRDRLCPPVAGEGEVLGACPLCRGEVRSAGRRGWACGGCSLSIPALVARRELSPRMARALLSQGQTPVVKGFRSKAGKEFSAALRLDPEGKVVFHFPEPEALGNCPACGKPVRFRRAVYSCDTGRDCAFVVYAEMSGLPIPESAVRSLLADGRSEALSGFQDRDGGAPYTGVLSWTGERVIVRRHDPRSDAGPVGACPRCHGNVLWREKNWQCDDCRFHVAGTVARREIMAPEMADLLAHGRTHRLHGFRQQSGAVFKAALFLDPQGVVQLDYTKPADEAPEPLPTGPTPAFGQRVDCPLCVSQALPEPGYLVAGRAAWGCSRWREGCAFQVPFLVGEHALTEDEVRRLCGKNHATRFIVGLMEGKRARIVVDPQAQKGWRMEGTGTLRGREKKA